MKPNEVCTTSADLIFELSLPAALPLLEDFSQLVQAGVVEVEDLVLALPAGDHQLATGAGLIATAEQEMVIRTALFSANQCKKKNVFAKYGCMYTGFFFPPESVTLPRLLTPPRPGTPDSPEEEPQRPHVTQVHPENAAQLLQRQHLLLLLPPGALQLAAVVGGGVAVQAGGGAHGLGHGLVVALLPGGHR